MLRKIDTLTDCKNISDFKRVILIGRRLEKRELEVTGLEVAGERIFSKNTSKLSHKTTKCSQEYIDRAKSFGILPGPLLSENIGDEAVQMTDFSYCPFKLVRFSCNKTGTVKVFFLRIYQWSKMVSRCMNM